MNSNKRIAANTAVLYIKLIISIIIGLYTSRVVLLALGSSDFGLYSVVGGIVTLLNIIGITMVSTSYRYISVEIGKGTLGNPNKVYNTVLVIHIVLALFLLIIGSGIGTWYINNYLNVQINKIPDAKFVLYASLFTAAFTIIAVPSNGLIIAREKFIFTSSIEIIQYILQFVLIVFVLQSYAGNKLRLYAILLALVNLITPITYTIYCNIKESKITKWIFNRSKKDYKEIIIFTWWLFCGAICVIGNNQGAAVIINLFFGTSVNAAYGIAIQVQKYIMMFVKNLSQATVPQIMQNYSAGNEDRSLSLVYKISKYSFFTMLVIAVPALISINDILQLWLKKVPEYTNIFTSFLIVNGIIACLGSGFDALIQATGKIKMNQMGYSIINLSLLPIIFILYKMGCPPYVNVIVMIILTFITLVFQVYIMKHISKFNVKHYLIKTILPAIKTSIIIIPIIFIRSLFNHSLITVIMMSIIVVIFVLIYMYIVGLDKEEKQFFYNYIKSKMKW